jgi:hypothetical protein
MIDNEKWFLDDNDSQSYRIIIHELKWAIHEKIEKLRELEHIDSRILGDLYALTVLCNASPFHARSKMRTGQLKEWRDTFFDALDRLEKPRKKTMHKKCKEKMEEYIDILLRYSQETPRDFW